MADLPTYTWHLTKNTHAETWVVIETDRGHLHVTPSLSFHEGFHPRTGAYQLVVQRTYQVDSPDKEPYRFGTSRSPYVLHCHLLESPIHLYIQQFDRPTASLDYTGNVWLSRHLAPLFKNIWSQPTGQAIALALLWQTQNRCHRADAALRAFEEHIAAASFSLSVARLLLSHPSHLVRQRTIARLPTLGPSPAE